MAKASTPKKNDSLKADTKEGRFLSLDMTFGEAIKKAATTPKPKKKAKK